MGNKIANFFRHHFNSIILGFYLGTIFNIQISITAFSNALESNIIKACLIIVFILIYVLTYFISNFLLKQINKYINIKKNQSLSRKEHYKLFAVFLLVSLAITFIWFIAYKPGSFSLDSVNQYEQAITNTYSDWHPTLHTILFFKLPMLISNNSPEAIIIFQIILFCLVVSYSLLTIYETAGKKWGITSAIVILANPMVMDELMSPWKDVAFAIFALLTLTIILKIYTTNSKWSNKNIWPILLSIILGCTTILRHNAILFTLPLIIGLFFFLNHRQWIKLISYTLIIIFIIKVPLYSILQVTPASNRTQEVTGLSLSIIGSVAKNTPDLLDEESSNLIYSIASQEQWSNQYAIGDFNSIKWQGNLSKIEELGTAKILILTAKSFLNSPIASANGLFKATQVVYNLEKTENAYSILPDIATNKYDISYSGNSSIRSAIGIYRKIFENTFLHYFMLIGTTIFLMISFILSKNRWKNSGWKKIILCSAVIIYDFGTMLLLTGPETRFFYINFLTYPIIIILASKQISHNKSSKS